MKVNTNEIAAASIFAGFSNYSEKDFSTTIGGGNLSAGGFTSATATVNFSHGNSISEVKIQYSGLDTFWRLLPGSLIVDYPDATSPSYQIESFSYFSGNTLSVTTYISNQTGGTVSIPAITINCRAFLFIAPF